MKDILLEDVYCGIWQNCTETTSVWWGKHHLIEDIIILFYLWSEIKKEPLKKSFSRGKTLYTIGWFLHLYYCDVNVGFICEIRHPLILYPGVICIEL